MNIKDNKVTLDLDCGKAVKLAQMAIEIGETAATLERQTAEFAEAVHQVYQKPILKKTGSTGTRHCQAMHRIRKSLERR